MLTTQFSTPPVFFAVSCTAMGGGAFRSVPSPTPERKTISALVTTYMLKVKAKGVGHDSLAKNRLELGRFAAFMEKRGVLYVADCDLTRLLEYVDTWEITYPAGSTRKLVRHRLCQFLKFCVEVSELAKAPAIPKVIAKQEPPTLPLSRGEFARLLAVASDGKRPVRGAVSREVRRAVVLLMRWSGASITDAIMMRRECIFLDKEKGFYRCRYRRQKTRVLVNNPLPTDVAEEILRVAATCTSPTHLFQSAGNEGIGSNSKRRWIDWFHKAFLLAGMPHGHSHQLRDTFAVELLLQRVPLEAVAKALGHTSIKTTERYYAPWIKERQDLLDDTILEAHCGADRILAARAAKPEGSERQ